MCHFHLYKFLLLTHIFFDFAGSILTFMKVLKKLQDFTLPAGDAMLNKWIAALKTLNNRLQACDYSSVLTVKHETAPALRALLPSIPDKVVYAAVESLPKTFEAELEKKLTDGTASLTDMNKFFQFASHTMVSAMDKTTPTAETLN